ncbi:MAG: transporter associated domain-containing protein, partial [Stenotrophomonas sp.]
ERITGITLERSPLYVSLSGLLLHALERLPVVGDTVESAGWRLQVIDLEGRRIGKIRISAIDKQ